jgi:hypothetical protein
MTSTKEFFDTHVVGETLDWNDMIETNSSVSEKVDDETVRPGNLSKWTWSDLHGHIAFHVAEKIRKKGLYFSTTPDLVHPYTGKRLGVKLTQIDNPYYVVTSNFGQDPAYYATICPAEYVATMKIYSSSFVEKSGDYKNWENRVAAYNKKYPKNKF